MSRTRSGSLLIVTLWLVTMLSVLSVAIGRYLSLSVKMTRYRAAREQARMLARSGVYLAMQRLADDAAEADGKTYDWDGDEWAVVPGGPPGGDPSVWVIPFPSPAAGPGRLQGRLTVRVTDEERKLNLNAAVKEQLLAVAADDALAQAIIDARDEADTAEDRPDNQPPYFAKNGLFAVPEEWTDLPGMTPQAFDALRASTSPYFGPGAALNVNTASVEVLRALGLTETTVQMITRFREGPDGPQEHGADGVFTEAGLAIVQTLKDSQGVDLTGTPDGNLLGSATFGVASQTFTVSAEGIIERPAVRARVEAVVRRAPCPEDAPSPCIIGWREG
jgi:type II secretory pathway component PulK